MRVFVDLDGVLVDFVGRCVVDVFGHDLAQTLERWPVGQYSLEPLLCPGPDAIDCFWDMIELYDQRYGFWENLEPLPWWRDLLGLVKPFDWAICTTPSRSEHSYSGKRLWMRRQLGENFDRCILTGRKYLLAQPGSLLIDDSDANCDSFERAGGKSLLFPQIWNSARDLSDGAFDYVAARFAEITRGSCGAAW